MFPHRFPCDVKDLIYEGIATFGVKYPNSRVFFGDVKDLIYEGIATRNIISALPGICVIDMDVKDLIYEGIATWYDSFNLPSFSIVDVKDLIYEGIATS